MHGDLDHLEDLAAARRALCTDQYTAYCFVSPSRGGLKIGLRVDPVVDDAAYKHAWQTVADYHHQQYGVLWDPSGKDISRLCFMSWDPECYVNENAALFQVPLMMAPPPRPQTPPRPRDIPADRRERYAQQALDTAVKIIDASTLGTRHHARTKAAYLLGGYVAGGILDYGEPHAALEAAVTCNTDDISRSMKTIADCLQAGMEKAISLEALEAERHQWIQEHRAMPTHRATGEVTQNGPPPADPGPEAAPTAVITGRLPWSDYTNALALVREHGQDLRYCYPWGKWLRWTGTHWQTENDGAVMCCAKLTIKRLARHAEELEDDKAVKALLAHVKSSLATSKLKALVESAQSEPGIPVQPEDLDTNPWLLNCPNGTLDLRTGTLREHRREDLHTRCLAVAYDMHAICSTWDAFLNRIIAGNQNLISFLQRAVGYALTGAIREHVFLILWGTGRNGKSTFLTTLRALLGLYAMKAPSELLMVSNNDRHPTERADLCGKRFVAAIETEQGRRLAEVFVKETTGGDPREGTRCAE